MTTALERQPAVAPGYLGPARVQQINEDHIKVCHPEGHSVRARWAVAFPYQPRCADEVLLLGDGEGWYIIGVLHGRGVIAPRAHDKLSLHAVFGKLRIEARRGLHLRGAQLQLLASRQLRIAAERTHWEIGKLQRTVHERFDVFCQHYNDVCMGTLFNRSHKLALRVKQAMQVQGKTIRIG